MRHKFKFRQLGRDPKHRKSLIITMCTQLITHERIFTTLAKAKELRRHMEKLIHKAKRLSREDHLFLKQNLRTSEAIAKIKTEIAPRFRKLPAGFTRVESMGKRSNDRAEVGMIEIMGNEYQEMHRNRVDADKDQYGIETFW
jgi:large subunit ribosomal protein L17